MCKHKPQLFFEFDTVHIDLGLPWTFTSMIPVDGLKIAVLSNNNLVDKHPPKQIPLETLVVVTSLKTLMVKSLFHALSLGFIQTCTVKPFY